MNLKYCQRNNYKTRYIKYGSFSMSIIYLKHQTNIVLLKDFKQKTILTN